MSTIKMNCVVSTLEVMNYADAHPNERFDFTHFEFARNYTLVVSDDDTRIWDECIEAGIEPRELPNGWQRIGLCGWLCRKGDRCIYIS